MINTYWEELDMSNNILEAHEKCLETFDLPVWTKINCPYCNVSLSKRSIREIGMKFNSRNIGDITLEFCCDSCTRMNTLYYRNEIQNVKEFNLFLTGEKSPVTPPVLEEDMYKLKYNNLTDIYMVKL